MKISFQRSLFLFLCPLFFISSFASQEGLPKDVLQIMDQGKYHHAIWGIFVKDLHTGKILYDLNSEKLFSPASTTKLFCVASLLHAYGDDFQFKTPVYATNRIEDGHLNGDLILIGQGDFTFGGRQSSSDKISYTKLDHINANEVPGVILTKEDPLFGINQLATQIYENGLRSIRGDVVIDDTLFETIEKRGMLLSPLMINENLIDIIISPGEVNQKAKLNWRPKVPGYSVENEVRTVGHEGKMEIEINSDNSGHRLVVKGSIPSNENEVIRTFSIKDPANFVRSAFIQALEAKGIEVSIIKKNAEKPYNSHENILLALWTSPPLSEYAKLILKVSHNLGANLVPLLLASQQGQKTYDQGMKLLGDFAMQQVKLSPHTFVFIDGAGGNENRLTLQAEVQLLNYMYQQPPKQFRNFFDALPTLGVDGSLEDFAKGAEGANKVHAKPGTGVSFNLATGNFFLITQALAGYIEGKNGHLYAYEVVVNNAEMNKIQDIFAIFEDQGQLSNQIYMHSE